MPLNLEAFVPVIMVSSKVEESVRLVICLVMDAMQQVQTIALPVRFSSLWTLVLAFACLLVLILGMR